MNVNLFSFLIEVLGAFVVWAIKGFKGSFNDEMSGPYDSNYKSLRNALISFSIILIIFLIYEKMNVTDPESKQKEVKVELMF